MPAPTFPTVTATQLAASIQQVTHEVMKHGAVVITRHEHPTMVLMSIERFQSLEQQAHPNLEALTRRFDQMYDQMQAPGAAQAMQEAFAMPPRELAEAARHLAKPKSISKPTTSSSPTDKRKPPAKKTPARTKRAPKA